MSESPYKIGLEPKILSRAKLILGSLLLTLTIVTIAGVHQGITTGDFDRILLKPFREFAADFEKATQPSPTTTFSPMPSTSPTPTPVPIKKSAPAVQQTQPVYINCIRRNIREGEFASNKCYAQQDYEDLNYYLNQYNSAVGSVSFYETKVRISCGNNDFHKTCEQDKKDQQANLDNIPRYRSIIQGIIARGK